MRGPRRGHWTLAGESGAGFWLLYLGYFRFAWDVIARVTLDIALGKEFDYLIPAEMEDVVEVGTRVKVPFAKRQVLGCVTALLENSPHPNLRSILKTIGRQSHVTPKILELARWMADYYCCPPEIALKTVLPEAVRKEKEGWREQLFVRALPVPDSKPKLSKRQEEILEILRAGKELPLQDLLRQAKTTTQTLRRLEDKGLIHIAPQISERDPYAREVILPTEPLALNDEQQRAVSAINGAAESAAAQINPSRSSSCTASPAAAKPKSICKPSPRPAAGKRRDCPGAGDFVDAPDRRTIQGAFQHRRDANAGGGVAQPSFGGRTAR